MEYLSMIKFALKKNPLSAEWKLYWGMAIMGSGIPARKLWQESGQ